MVFDDQKQEKINSETLAIIEIQNKIIENKIELATSFILHYENGKKSDEEQMKIIDNFYRKYRKIYIGVEFSHKNDYTEWRRENLFENLSEGEFLKNAVDYAKNHELN